MSGLPRKISEFREMYRKDIEEIIEPYGFVYEDRDEYYVTKIFSAQEWRENFFLYYKFTDYGKAYVSISATGRLAEFRISANFFPAIQEVANIEYHVYEELCSKQASNLMRWREGAEGINIDLLPSSHIIRNAKDYNENIQAIAKALAYYLTSQNSREIFGNFLNYKPNFLKISFTDINFYRIGYWLILAKLAGEDYYQKYASKYVELNKEEIQKEYNVDITKLKEFLDTYTVGSLA